MAFLTGPLLTEAQDLYTSSSTQLHEVGQQAFGNGGRKYRYALAGAVDLVAGNLLQESAELTTYENMAIGTAGVAGDTFLQVTNGTSTITAAQFAGGTISIYTAGGIAIGDEYGITNITGTLTTGGALKVYLDRPLRAAASTATKVVMKRSPWSGAIQAPASTQTGIAVGVCIYPIVAAQYGWVLTHGECSVLSDGSTFAVGSDLGTPSGTAGCVTVFAAGTTHQRVGVAREAAASAHAIAAFIQID